MFILAWLLIQLLQANHLIIPHIVSLLVGVAALLEAGLYVFVVIMTVICLITAGRD